MRDVLFAGLDGVRLVGRYSFGLLLSLVVAVPSAFAARLANPFGIDAPKLSSPGKFAVGLRQIGLVDPARPSVLDFDPAQNAAPSRDRKLTVDVWYPAHGVSGGRAVTYRASLPSPGDKPPAQFSIQGVAVQNAKAEGTRLPLVVLSHGFSNATAALAWLGENLASKGYVVAAIRHEDASIAQPKNILDPLLNRPLDVAFVTKQLQERLGAERLIDPERVALIGYSMGGYGVLTAAGAPLDPAGPGMSYVPGGLMAPYARGAAKESLVKVSPVRAVVAISPVGGAPLNAWGAQGLAELRCPLLLISGDDDRTVNYETGARTFFDQAINAQRYLLTYRGAGHALGLGPTPSSMRGTLWDVEWFEDPVWRKDRIMGINAHFITAFLDTYLRGDTSRADYLHVAVADSAKGEWPDKNAWGYDAYSPGTGNITLWKGFMHRRATGLQLLEAPPR
jgi:predicted dienelactone hydrolase